MYHEKLDTPVFVVYQSPVFTGHCYLWSFYLTVQQGTEPTSLVSLNAEIFGVLSKLVGFFVEGLCFWIRLVREYLRMR